MGKFAVGIKAWGEKALKEFEDLRRAVILELFVSVILDNPVDTGRLRGNWQISIGSSKSGIVEVTETSYESESKSGKEWKSPRGPLSVSKRIEVEKVALEGKIGKDQAVYLTNNLPYVYKIEYDGWSHTKAPKGMVRKNFIRVSQNLKKQYG